MPHISLAVNDILQVRNYCWCEARTQLGINVLHYRVTAIDEMAESYNLSDIAEFLKGAWDTAYVGALSSSCHYLGVEVQRVLPTLSVTGFTTSVAIQGGAAADLLPGQVSGLIQLRTDFPGPRGRGRLYIPFPTEDDNQENGDPAALYVGTLQTLGDAFFETNVWSDLEDNLNVELVVRSRMEEMINPVELVRAIGKWATQRRRGMHGRLNDLPDWVPVPLPFA